MTIRLQEFGHQDSAYERPNQKWVCGWAADGRPCRLGPDGRGRCPAAAQSTCAPVREGDRWRCARPDVFGGPCPHGPRPDGACSHPAPEQTVCQPRLSLRARRGRLTVAACVLAVGALAVLLARPRGIAYLSPGPLTSAHAVMEGPIAIDAEPFWLRPTGGGSGYCAYCHVRAPDSGGVVQPVTDEACLACHVAEAHHAARSNDTAAEMQLDRRAGRAVMAADCTSCHMEHHGREATLSRVPDAACTRCHADLSPWQRGEPAHVASPDPLPPPEVIRRVPTRTSASITSFADHPEFAVLRDGRFDTARIGFEHCRHFDPDRMATKVQAWADQLAAAGTADHDIPLRRLDDGTLGLDCAACHRPDEAGRFMRPIRFDEHCAHCHAADLGRVTMSGGDEPVPHGAAARAFARIATQDVKIEAPPPPGNRRQAAPPPEPAATPASASDPRDLIPASGCVQCHGDVPPLEIENPGIPSRWLTRAAFNHETHRFIGDCLACHGGDAMLHCTDTVETDPARKKFAWTGRTQDIMLPSITTCRKCHAPAAVAGASAVRHDCVLCHEYHVPSLIDQAGGASPVTSSEYPTPRSSRRAAAP